MEAPMCKICEHRHYVRDPHIDLPAVPARAKSKVATPEHVAAQRTLNVVASKRLEAMKDTKVAKPRKRAKKKAKKK